jgi:hypothetical protein
MQSPENTSVFLSKNEVTTNIVVISRHKDITKAHVISLKHNAQQRKSRLYVVLIVRVKIKY